MHGREFGYDTLLNSTKSFVFLIAIIELAQPRARALADERRQLRSEIWAGSQETDEHGARRDRRGFDHAKRCLRAIAARMATEYRRSGHYPARALTELFPGSIGDKLVDHERTVLIVAPAGGSYYAYQRTPSGYVLGVAATDEPWFESHFAGPSAPTGGVGEDDWRGVRDEIAPDWAF